MAKISYGHLCPREENLTFDKDYIFRNCKFLKYEANYLIIWSGFFLNYTNKQKTNFNNKNL
jgi:hypothetical protein